MHYDLQPDASIWAMGLTMLDAPDCHNHISGMITPCRRAGLLITTQIIAKRKLGA